MTYRIFLELFMLPPNSNYDKRPYTIDFFLVRLTSSYDKEYYDVVLLVVLLS